MTVVVLVAILLAHEYEHIFHFVKYVCGKQNYAGVPTPCSIRTRVHAKMHEFGVFEKTNVLIDFGCGNGDIIKHFSPFFCSSIGIEIHTEQANFTRSRFAGDPKIQILNMDMCSYVFPRDKAFTLFIYEPLWQLDSNKALPIYCGVFENMNKVKQQICVVYIGASRSSQLDETFFRKFGFSPLWHDRARRYLHWKANNIYIFYRGHVTPWFCRKLETSAWLFEKHV